HAPARRLEPLQRYGEVAAALQQMIDFRRQRSAQAPRDRRRLRRILAMRVALGTLRFNHPS
ncbi:MAG TPA: hypothetical protein VFV07_07020, partial [Rhizomicrobium sp.]|nr:hypothetical protein [Rhizomicrobium sp.]